MTFCVYYWKLTATYQHFKNTILSLRSQSFTENNFSLKLATLYFLLSCMASFICGGTTILNYKDCSVNQITNQLTGSYHFTKTLTSGEHVIQFISKFLCVLYKKIMTETVLNLFFYV